jgi:hypothetical protein
MTLDWRTIGFFQFSWRLVELKFVSRVCFLKSYKKCKEALYEHDDQCGIDKYFWQQICNQEICGIRFFDEEGV